MSAALWGGEGNWTRTGATRPRNVAAPAPDYLAPMFASDELWHEAHADCLDAPEHIARGGVKLYEFDSGPMLFASEPRP
jgi:hypothetical protein